MFFSKRDLLLYDLKHIFSFLYGAKLRGSLKNQSINQKINDPDFNYFSKYSNFFEAMIDRVPASLVKKQNGIKHWDPSVNKAK